MEVDEPRAQRQAACREVAGHFMRLTGGRVASELRDQWLRHGEHDGASHDPVPALQESCCHRHAGPLVPRHLYATEAVGLV